LINVHRRRRPKVFGQGRCVPLTRDAKCRIMVLARALSRRTEPGRHYGLLTAKFVAVLQALLWDYHNAASGKCFPSYEAIAARAACARSSVASAIRALERAGILSWANRIVRVRERCEDLFGRDGWRWRVLRTSNAYVFFDPQARFSSRSKFPTRTENQELNLEPPRAVKVALDHTNPLHRALLKLKEGVSNKNFGACGEIRGRASG